MTVDLYDGALLVRELDDGRVIVVYAMLFNDRLCIGPSGEPVYDRGWCYPKGGHALAVAQHWDGQGTPPGPIIKEAGT